MKRNYFLLIVAAVASLVMIGSVSVQAKSNTHAIHRAPVTGVELSPEPRVRTEAIALVGGNEFSVASETPGGWPDETPGHWHSDDSDTYDTGTDWMEVGECCDDGNFEEARGMAEFDLSDAFTADSATVEVQVAQLGGLWGQIGPGDFTIEVYTYQGNNAEDISDYSIAATLLTSFSTSGLSVAQVLQFDVTAAFNAAVGAADTSFGIRFQAASEPSDAAVVFGNAALIVGTDLPSAAVEQGALAYSNWTKTDAGGSGSLPTGVDSQDYIRCKACHGWDHNGMDGGYARRTRKDSRPNAGAGDGDTTSRVIVTGTITADMITHTGTGRAYTDGMASWVALGDSHSAANKAAHANGYTLGNQHPDLSADGLTQTQIDNLVAFLNFSDGDSSMYFSNINPSQNPVLYTIVDTADAAAGETYYNSNCDVCHGDPATDHDGLNGGHPDGGLLAYLTNDGKFSEFAHKARWGIPNTTMDRSTIGSPTSQNIADVMLYLQDLGETGFAINSGLSGAWWGSWDRNGEGFMIEVAYSNDALTLVGSFYTYDSEGAPEWLFAVGAADTGMTSNVTIYVSDGQRTWGEVGNPSNPPTVEWGTGTFTFTSCSSGTFTFTPNATYMALGFTEISYALERNIISDISCPTVNNEAK